MRLVSVQLDATKPLNNTELDHGGNHYDKQ